MLIKTFGGAVHGVNAAIITIEVNIIQGASFYLVGLPDSAVKESQFRIESTFKSNNYRMPGRRVIVNMAPAEFFQPAARSFVLNLKNILLWVSCPLMEA
jgi:magnesium chelatase family protein